MSLHPSDREPLDRIRAAVDVLADQNYPLPWHVARRCYDSENVIASGNVVVTGGFACPGNTELRKAVVEIVNAAAALAATLPASEPSEAQIAAAIQALRDTKHGTWELMARAVLKAALTSAQ